MDGKKKTLLDLGLTPTHEYLGHLTGLSLDSRKTKDGNLFAALPGENEHGAKYVAEAVGNGAKVILTDPEGLSLITNSNTNPFNSVLVVTEEARAALAGAASLWYEMQPKNLVAVTGTNGKTSVTTFCRQIWTGLGLDSVNIGTNGVEGVWQYGLSLTTPDPIILHKILAESVANGVTHAALEASSHGLHQKRLEGARLTAAAFTNFSHDHLDYHKSFDEYLRAKLSLFDSILPPDGIAVINIDDEKGYELSNFLEERGQEVVKIGRRKEAQLRLLSQSFQSTSQTVRYSWLNKIFETELSLIGGFQAENVLVAAAIAIATGGDSRNVFAAMADLKTVEGRMDLAVKRRSGAAIFVDYAHTPEALKTAIKALRQHVMGRIFVIIGAGGDRDHTKRSIMGWNASAAADFVIVTDDNPRTEDPKAIRKMILAGIENREKVLEVPDRAEAILRAIDLLEAGDALLITGKGHETGQIIGEDVFPFNDGEQASLAVAALDEHIL